MSRDTLYSGFAVCPKGLEALCAEELSHLEGLSECQAGRGGAQFRGTAEGFARANLWCRFPTRILLLLDQFRLRTAEDLLSAARRVPWERYMTPEQCFRVDANQAKAPLFKLSLGFASLRIKDGLCDRMREQTGRRPDVDTHLPDIRVWLFVDADKATLSIDTTGEPLFKRGWRFGKGEAPLRENLAAALMQVAQWDGASALHDPMSGSGTLIIEALSTHLGLASGFHPARPRSFAFEGFAAGSGFQRLPMTALRQECAQRWLQAESVRLPTITAWDNDARMVKTTQDNLSRALPNKIAQQVQCAEHDFFNTAAPGAAGMLVTNPPYGVRLNMAEENEDKRRISEVLKRHYAGWAAWILSDDLQLDRAIRLKAARRFPVFNGDIECRWMRFDMVAGSAR